MAFEGYVRKKWLFTLHGKGSLIFLLLKVGRSSSGVGEMHNIHLVLCEF